MKYFYDDDGKTKEELLNSEEESNEENANEEAAQSDQIADAGRTGMSMDDDEEENQEEDDKKNNNRNRKDNKDNKDNDEKSDEETAKEGQDVADETGKNLETAEGEKGTPSTDTADMTTAKTPKQADGVTPDEDPTASQSSPGTETPANDAKTFGEGNTGPGNDPMDSMGKNPTEGGSSTEGMPENIPEKMPGTEPLGEGELGPGANAAKLPTEGGMAEGEAAGEMAAAETGTTAAAETGTAAAATTEAGGAAVEAGGAAAGGAAAGGAGVALVYVGIIILVIIILIGVAGFFLTMPQFLWNKLKNMAVSLWSGFYGYFVGMDEATVHDDDIKAVAQYLHDMGYDLVGMGFASEVEINERDPKTGKLKDEDVAENQIISVEAPYLKTYLVAENRTYMINNYTFNMADAVASIFKTGNFFNEGVSTWGTGLINLDQSFVDAFGMPLKSLRIGEFNVGEFMDGIKVERSSNTLRIRRLNFDWFNTHNDYTYYSLAGWSGRYGKPFELSVTLHVATMAPDLVKEFCNNEDLDAKVNIRMKKSDISGQLLVDGKTIDELEAEGTYDEDKIKELRDFESKNVSEIKTKIPYISSVTKHWFRNVYFEGPDSIDESGRRVGGVQIGVDEDEDDIEDYNEERGPKTQKTTTLSSSDNVYTFGGESGTGEFSYSGDGAPDVGGAKITIQGTFSNSVVQNKDAVRGVTNVTTKGLFKEKYYIYDGTVEKAEQIREAKANNNEAMKEEVKMTKESLSAFSILESSETLDAQYIYRDLKELVIELGYFEREDFDEIEKNVLEWPIPKYIPGEWPARKFEKQVLEYGTLIACEETCANAYGLSIEDLRKLTNQKEEKEKKELKLDGTLFIGDSYIVGLSQAGGIENAEWQCKSGMAAYYFLPRINELPERARRIFVYLGVNRVTDTDSMKSYIDALRAKYPNAKIYVSEVMHLGRNYNGGGANADRMNTKIDEYNAIIKAKCDSTDNVYYVITSEGIVVDGYLAHPSADGIHMTGSDYTTWAKNIANAIQAAGDLMPNSETNEQFVIDFLAELEYVTTRVKEEGYTYGDADYMPPNDEGYTTKNNGKVISCDRMVAWALYRMGYRDQPEKGLVVSNLEGYLESKGWKKIESQDRVQAGDVVFSNPDEDGKPQHTFVCAGENKRYDCGSAKRISSDQPFNEPITGFICAYRVTGNGMINPGFGPDLDVIAMCNGTVTEVYKDGENVFSEGYLSKVIYGEDLTKTDESVFRPSEQTDEGLRMRISDPALRNYQLVMYGFDVDDGIAPGTELKAKDVIGKTKKSDICLILIDRDKSVCENIEEYIKVPEKKKKGKHNGMRIEDDFDVHDETNFIPDIETFIQMFEGYENIVANAEAFMEIQDKYQVNAAFAACVTIAESSGGTGWAAIAPYTYNWFSIKGSYHGKSYVSPSANKGPWRWYPSFAAAVDDFGDLIANGSYYYKQGKYTVNQIGPTYCDEKWSETVNKLMKTAYEKVI